MTTDTFTCVRVEGAILPTDLLQRVAAGDARLEGLRVEDYGLVGEKVNEATNHAWTRLSAAWDVFKAAKDNLPPADPGHKLTVERWLLPLWKVLGYSTLDKVLPFVIDEKTYPVSHVRHHSPFHLVGFRQDLDKRVETDGKQFSPHGLVQEFLNRSGNHLWGFVSNGLKLRILRDNIRLTRQAFVEFDLQAMFDGKQYADFALLWRLCHESRVNAEKREQCWLERWSKIAAEQGLRALDQLRTGVENAVKALGRGFLACSANADLKAALKHNRISPLEYYRQLLRVVYRFLFLFVAEDRELLCEPSATDDAKGRYTNFYSAARLRRIAERLRGSPHTDLYEGLSLVLDKLGTTGCPELALPAFGGLFDPARTSNLAGCRLTNADLLEAVRALSVINDGKSRRSVDYRNLGAEELGSVYESLLELQPRFDPDAIAFTLESASGNERKTTGSYYTPTSLITCLLDSALDPVLAEAAAKPNPEDAILALKVCDPACGSGHFLIAAAHRVAKKLAAVRTFEEEPAPDAVRHALRDVIGRCIYGVDINPMAVELCQVALWMEALEPGKPLSFLDHHIQCGNSLLGTTPALLAKGIPDEAFEPIEGDDKKWCSVLKRQNKDERRGQEGLFDDLKPWEQLGNLPAAMAKLEGLPDDTVERIREKERQYAELKTEAAYRTSGRFLADAWCAAFVWKKVNDDNLLPMTHARFRKIEKHPHDIGPQEFAEVRRLAEQYEFFHWHLGFPGVFRYPAKGESPDNELTGWCGGFDVVLGNPPWEMAELSQKEYFASREPRIANARTAKDRKELIDQLAAAQPSVFAEYVHAKRQLDSFRAFVQNSSRYPTSSTGRINSYPLFVECTAALVNNRGMTGQIVPSAIAMDAYNAALFSWLTLEGRLVQMLDFENRDGLFAHVHRSYRFSLLTLRGNIDGACAFHFLFFGHDPAEVDLKDRVLQLTLADLQLCSPNTLAPPMLQSQRDASIALDVYKRLGVLVKRHDTNGSNPWSVSIQRMLSLSDPGNLFQTTDRLSQEGEALDAKEWARLYSGKAIHQFNHRFSTWINADWEKVSLAQLTDPSFQVITEYAVRLREVIKRTDGKTPYNWLIGYRDVCRATDERTAIAAIIPHVGCDTHCRNVYFESVTPNQAANFVAIFNSFAFDYFCRQKVVAIGLGSGVVEQLPFLHPDFTNRVTPWDSTTDCGQYIIVRVVELVYTALDMKPFAEDCGYSGEPFSWDESRRAVIRAELDAAFFHLYGISEADADYILDTFPIVKSKDVERFGTYRTKEMILDYYRQMAGGNFVTSLNPLPGVAVAKPKADIQRLSRLIVTMLQAAKAAGVSTTRQELTLGLALCFNPAARKAVLGKPLSTDEQQQLNDLPEYVVGLNEILVRQLAQGLIHEHEGLILPGSAARPFNQAPQADREVVQEVIQAVSTMQPTDRAKWSAKANALNPVS